MPEVTIQDTVWQGLVEVAKKRRQKPETLAGAVLREFLQRQADEELLAKSAAAAKKTAFHLADTEEVIRQFRKRKKNA